MGAIDELSEQLIKTNQIFLQHKVPKAFLGILEIIIQSLKIYFAVFI